jgi:hypothetical protein
MRFNGSIRATVITIDPETRTRASSVGATTARLCPINMRQVVANRTVQDRTTIGARVP